MSSRTTWRRAKTKTRSGVTPSCGNASSTSTSETGGHRRFFDVDDLAGVRVEDAAVFETTHRLVLDLVRGRTSRGSQDRPHRRARRTRGAIFERLRENGVEQVWVEKILEHGEQLRDWPVLGTTGYEFANDVQALFVDPAAETISDRARERT